MTNYKQGDIVLVDFGFSEGVGSNYYMWYTGSKDPLRDFQPVLPEIYGSEQQKIYGSERLDRSKNRNNGVY